MSAVEVSDELCKLIEAVHNIAPDELCQKPDRTVLALTQTV
jgi:hypothetical protein